MPDPGFVTVFHPETGNYAEQPQSGLAALYRAGWALVTESPPADPEPEARHISREDAEAARAQVLSGAPPAELNAQGQVPRTEATPGDGSDRTEAVPETPAGASQPAPDQVAGTAGQPHSGGSRGSRKSASQSEE